MDRIGTLVTYAVISHLLMRIPVLIRLLLPGHCQDTEHRWAASV